MGQPEDKKPDFEDPLSDYSETYADALEQALSEEPVTAIQAQPFASVSPDTPISAAVELLSRLHVACLLVADGDKLLGVFTDRDVLDRVALEYDSVKDQPISTVMTPDPVFVYETDSTGAALAVIAVSGHRHVPVLTLDGSVVGVVSPHRVTGFLQSVYETT
ncbi:CBS domain-containing protein [Botrimarina sp.]|uniref:CBS domain-containing protein n=1 Tax=Botrimarina sp. TaxID=2795802 RepID=UPI0032F011C2